MNPWQEFKALLPEAPLLYGTVTAHNADGTSSVQFPGGQQCRARGQSVAIGAAAFVRDGEIRGPAPAVVPVTLEV